MARRAPFTFQMRLAILLFLATLLWGSAGYVLIEGYPLIDAFYMTVITVTTVGFGEVHPLSNAGRLFTSFLILAGFATLAFFGNALLDSLVQKMSTSSTREKKMKRKIARLTGHTIVCGSGRVGSAAVETLKKAGAPFVVIESDAARCSKLMDEGTLHILGSALSETGLMHARIKDARGLLALLDTDPDNLFLTLTARELNPTLHIVARGEGPGSDRKLQRAGADRVISPFSVAGIQIARDHLEALSRNAACSVESSGPEVLCADPHDRTRSLYMRLLRQAGFRPISATSTDDAWRLLTTYRPGLAVIDRSLAPGSALDLCRKIRREESLSATRIVLFGIEHDACQREEAFAAGADACLPRSNDGSALVMTLENLRRGGHEIPDHGDDAPVSPALDVGSDPVASPLEQWRRNEAAGGDGSFLEDLLGAFLASTPHVVEELRRALDHGDRDDVQRTAKALELSLDRVGATTARDLARELAEHEGNDQSAAKILASLDREVEVVTRKLGERMQG